MVGRHHQHDCVPSHRLHVQRRQSKRRCRIAPRRLQNQGLGRHPHAAHLLGDQKAMRFVAHHQRPCAHLQASGTGKTPHGRLKQRIVLHKRDHLLRIMLARQRPQASTRPTGKNDRLNFHEVWRSVKLGSVKLGSDPIYCEIMKLGSDPIYSVALVNHLMRCEVRHHAIGQVVNLAAISRVMVCT